MSEHSVEKDALRATGRRDWLRRLRLAWCALKGHATKCLRCGS